MAAQVAGQEAKHRVRQGLERSTEVLSEHRLGTTLKQVETLALGLSELKGAAMKAGQLLSIDASDVLPPEAVRILSRLQADAAPVPFEGLAQVLDEDLGPAGRQALEDLNPAPVASASIGQVHRARYQGRDVAVKIQYPGIAASIDADLAMLHRVSSSWLRLTGRRIDLERLFEEMKSVLHHEADYMREARFMRRFHDHLEGDATLLVPEPIGDLCGPRVLTAEWAEGTPLGAWIKPDMDPDEATWFAETILGLYCREFFEWGLVQTDPNPGNYLVRPEQRQVVLLDFGATLEYGDAFRSDYLELLITLGRGDRAAIIEMGLSQELIDPRESAEVKELFAELLLNAVEPFLPNKQPFDFRDPDYMARAGEVGRAFTTQLRYSPPPRDLVFLHRKLGGLFHILRRMGVRLDLEPYWDRMVGSPLLRN